MASSATSKVRDTDWKYPQPPLNKADWLTVSQHPPHRIYWEEYGNPKGEPVLFVHGGPGGASEPVIARFFDPERYRIILFDQRGCGKSTPSASEDDPVPALTDNTTNHLIDDISKLRRELGINGKMHVFGGSWGSTLALAYAIRHPETVEALVLRGIFLCRKQDLDYFYQGNAATYAERPFDPALPGAYQSFPEPWKQFVEVIPAGKRGDMVRAYAEIFAMNPKNDSEREYQDRAALAWSVWEGSTSYLEQDMSDLGKFSDPVFAKAFAKIENHFFMNGAFLGGAGQANREQDYLLENVGKIRDIPVHIVQGRYDQVCPLFQAEELVAALKNAGARQVDFRITIAGHSAKDRENSLALMDVMDSLPPMAPPLEHGKQFMAKSNAGRCPIP